MELSWSSTYHLRKIFENLPKLMMERQGLLHSIPWRLIFSSWCDLYYQEYISHTFWIQNLKKWVSLEASNWIEGVTLLFKGIFIYPIYLVYTIYTIFLKLQLLEGSFPIQKLVGSFGLTLEEQENHFSL